MDLFSGRKALIATMHGKERVLAPLFQEALGLFLSPAEGFDTDQFGTFSGEKERKGSQLDAARAKADAAMDFHGTDLAISSEGAFSPHHHYFFTVADYELVLLRDRKNNAEWQGWHVSMDVKAGSRAFNSEAEAMKIAREFGFPSHGMLVKVPAENGFLYLRKGLQDDDELQQAIRQGLALSSSANPAIIENDLRAHFNPTRMENIRKAGENLLSRLAVGCPECSWPGFGIIDQVKGLPCEECRTPTDMILHEIHACNSCNYRMIVERPDGLKKAEAMYCPRCNP